jgi:type I restriction enzyme S subunit
MKKYNAYKDSGVKWIGEIPSHWKMVINGMLFHEEIRKPEIQDMPLSLSQKSGVVFADELDIKTLRTSSYENWKRVIENDLVLNRFKAHLGVLFASSLKGMVSFHYGVFAPRIKLLPKYYEYLFHTEKYKYKYAASSKGMTVGLQNLSNQDFYAVKSIFPPYEEQQAIVDYLKDKTLKIEQYVSARERERELFDSLKQSEIANIVTKGLNPNVKMKDSGIPWIGEIPEHWEVRTLSQMSRDHFISNKNVHHQNLLSLSYGKIVNKDINTTEGLLPASFDSYQIVEDGNIVLRLTDLQNDHKSLRVGLSTQEGIITSAYLALETFNDIIPLYLYYLLHTIDVKKVFYSMGNGLRQSLNWTELRKLKCVVPPLSEQQAIVAYIDEKLQKIDQYMTDLQREIDYLKEFKQRLISDAVTGQLCITNQ